MLTDRKLANAMKRTRDLLDAALDYLRTRHEAQALDPFPAQDVTRAWQSYNRHLQAYVSLALCGQMRWKLEEWMYDEDTQHFHFELHSTANLYSPNAELGCPDMVMNLRTLHQLDAKASVDTELARLATDVARFEEHARTMEKQSLRTWAQLNGKDES